MRYAIDRMEDTKAVLEDETGNCIVVDTALLPSDATMGDVLAVYDGCYCHDRDETVSRRTRIHRLEQLLQQGKERK